MSSQSEYTLENGLSLLKQKDYLTAKAMLEFVAQNSPNPWVAVQAQIGFVVACARVGDIESAIAVCDILRESNRTQVKAWAVRVRKILVTRQPVDTQMTGFVPLESNREPESFDILELAAPSPDSEPKTTIHQVSTPVPTPKNTVQSDSIPKPSAAVQTNQPSPTPQTHTILWRNATRAKIWQGLAKTKLWPLWGLEVGTGCAVFILVRELAKFALATINNLLLTLPLLEPIQLFYADPSRLIFAVLLLFAVAAPWLLDIYLSFWYGTQPLSKDLLHTHSPESLRVLQRYIQPRKLSLPKLQIIPINTPLLFAYGHLPRTMRIVMSQGLFETLADDEIAVIMAGQLAHNRHWDMAVISWVLTLTLPIYQLYRSLAHWGDKTSQPFLQSFIAIITNATYLLWSLLTGSTIWLNRIRIEYSDRTATDTTGNPNGLIRALLKISVGIASNIHNQTQTPWQLESLNIATPVSLNQSITTGSLAPQISWESLLMWEYLNPYRRWLSINNTHPLLGDRIQVLARIAHQLHLEPELDIASQPAIKVPKQKFLIQIAPFCLGIPFGLLMAGIIGATWQIAFALKIINLKWIYDNWNFVTGCVLIGFSLGTLVRIEQLFPDLKSNSIQTDTQIAQILTNPTSLPIQPTQIQLQGKLLGRAGTANSLGQDLILDTHNTLIKLHHIPRPGYPIAIQTFIGRQVTVIGWLRRGATPWIDIQSIHTQSRRIPNIHPIWSYIIAFSTAVWGAVILLRGY